MAAVKWLATMDLGNFNPGLASAFPKSLRVDVLRAVSALPEPFLASGTVFQVVVEGAVIVIPYRVYYETTLINSDLLTSLHRIIIDCVLTRHHSGFVREQHLKRIVSCRESWIPPFVIQLIGEYVVEILRAIYDFRTELDAKLYRGFLEENPAFWAKTKQRVVSYWDCYYRRTWKRREDYVGFQLVNYLDALPVSTDQKPSS